MFNSTLKWDISVFETDFVKSPLFSKNLAEKFLIKVSYRNSTLSTFAFYKKKKNLVCSIYRI